MNKKIVIVYFSKYGTTKQYAKWIAEELNCTIYDIKTLGNIDLTQTDTIILSSGLYAGGIKYKNLFENNKSKNLIVVTVGLSDPNTTDYSEILDNNFNPELQSKIRFFHLRGGIDYNKLSFWDRLLMFLLKKTKLDKKPEQEKTSDEILMGETFGKKINFVDRNAINPIVEYVKELSTKMQSR